ncbi:MAG TPA: viscotoxin-A3 [Eggerthellaceae bacterium]|nr:viscotoxin-A3 [Eggerthellaceae bacterium]
MAELTDEQIAEEELFLEGLPRMNWGAFLMPGIWGPAHGFWVCILFYPLWVFIDYLIYGAYIAPTPLNIALAVGSSAVLFAVTLGFALVSQPLAAHRAANRGVSREQYLKRERIWAVVCLVIAIAALAWATYYNLEVRTVLK